MKFLMPHCAPKLSSEWLRPEFVLALHFLFLSVLAGCADEPGITVYSVPRADSERSSSSTAAEPVTNQQMLAAIVPNGNAAWFFKLTGDPEVVRNYESEFRGILKSIQFSESGAPAWQLPGGWSDEPGSGMTFASWEQSDAGLKATVTNLPITEMHADEEGWQSYVVQNVNRWRGQLSLANQVWDTMAGELEDLQFSPAGDRRPAYYVSLVGKGSGAMRPPFASGAMGGMPSLARDPKATSAGGQSPDSVADEEKSRSPESGLAAAGPEATELAADPGLEYEVPDGWRQEEPKNSMRKAQFAIDAAEGSQPAEVVISQAGGEIAANMKMWIGQVGGQPTDESVADSLETAEQVVVGKVSATVYTMNGKELGGQEDMAMLLAEIPLNGNSSLFVKMVGSMATVSEQRETFKSFVTSIVLPDAG